MFAFGILLDRTAASRRSRSGAVMKHWLLHVFYILAISWIAYMPQAHAYIDPGTGSMLLQALLAAFFAVLIFGKNIYYRIAGIFKPKDQTADKDENQDAHE